MGECVGKWVEYWGVGCVKWVGGECVGKWVEYEG